YGEAVTGEELLLPAAILDGPEDIGTGTHRSESGGRLQSCARDLFDFHGDHGGTFRERRRSLLIIEPCGERLTSDASRRGVLVRGETRDLIARRESGVACHPPRLAPAEYADGLPRQGGA